MGSLQTRTPVFSLPSGSAGQAWKRPGSRPAVGSRFPQCDKRAEGRPGAGRRAAGGAGGPRPGPGTALRGMGPGGDPPPTSPREGRALTVQGQEVPARVHSTDGVAEGCAPRDTRPRRQRGGLGSERSVVEGPEWTAGAGRRWARDSAPPPARPRPRPASPTASPRPSWGLAGRAEVGAWKPGYPWPRPVGASRTEIARSLWLPPGRRHPQAAGPVISAGDRAPTPCLWALRRVTVMRERICVGTRTGNVRRPARLVQKVALESSRGSPMSTFSSAEWVHELELEGPRRGMPGSSLKKGPPSLSGKFLTLEVPFGGAWGRSHKT